MWARPAKPAARTAARCTDSRRAKQSRTATEHPIHSPAHRVRVLHFVTGGFSGATQVAIDLSQHGKTLQGVDVLLALRKKKATPEKRIQQLRGSGLRVELIPGWSHLATIISLWRLCRSWRPDVFVAHGFSEHLWGRYAAILAGIPTVIHVEHNSRERYTPFRRLQSQWLAKRTDAIVGVSEGVLSSLLALGFPPAVCTSIPNGIDVSRFAAASTQEWRKRKPVIVMAARFGRQKDHKTLIHALHLLASQNIRPVLYLAGTGKRRDIVRLKKLTQICGLENQVFFLGQTENLAKLLIESKYFVLSTHYEGMPLALIEAMAAGCACIATNVIGVREIIDNEKTGILVTENDAQSLASAIKRVVEDHAFAESLGKTALVVARSRFSIERMHQKYHDLITGIHSRKNGNI